MMLLAAIIAGVVLALGIYVEWQEHRLERDRTARWHDSRGWWIESPKANWGCIWVVFGVVVFWALVIWAVVHV